MNDILSYNADYNIVIGERSNGKTYAGLLYAVEQFYKSGYKKQFAVIRRWKEDIKGKRGDTLFSPLIQNRDIYKATRGEYESVVFYNGRYYLSNWDSDLNKWVSLETPMGYSFALSDMEHDKSTSYPNVTTVIFDEFLTRKYYLPDEFILFLNVLSTIIRNRNDVKIFMFGNTVNKFCPYFKEMGLTHVKDMEQGTIDLYKFGDQLTIAVEYAESIAKEKKSNKYFAFDDSSAVQMIINGKWEMAIYPHLSVKYKPTDILLTYFIEFNGNLLQCEIIQKDDSLFTYVHEKTTPIYNPESDIIYSLDYSELPNRHRRLMSSATKLEKKIAMFYATDKVFFQNNECGEVVRNYLRQSQINQFAT